RPGLSAAQYRSLLINTAATASIQPGSPARVQQAGAGLLDVSAALRATVATAPSSIGFGAGGGGVQTARNLTISNVGTAEETFSLSAVPRDGGPVPELPVSSITLSTWASKTLTLNFAGASPPPGHCERFIIIQARASGH